MQIRNAGITFSSLVEKKSLIGKDIGNGNMMKEYRIEADYSIDCSSCHKTMPRDQ